MRRPLIAALHAVSLSLAGGDMARQRKTSCIL